MLGLVAVACALPGCLSAVVEEKRIGARADQLEYERAVRSADQVLLFYCFRRGSDRCDPKWSAIDVTRVDWTVLEAEGHVFPRDSVRVSIEDGPRPAIDPESAVEIPIVDLGAQNNSIGYPGGPTATDMLSRSAGRALTLYSAGGYSMMLVSRQHGAPGDVGIVQAINPTREYLTWWAVPARASLYAVTVPIDVAASPIELLGMWIVARGLAE
jgi:hypothetical protein